MNHCTSTGMASRWAAVRFGRRRRLDKRQQVPTGLVNSGLQYWPAPLETFEVYSEAYLYTLKCLDWLGGLLAQLMFNDGQKTAT